MVNTFSAVTKVASYLTGGRSYRVHKVLEAGALFKRGKWGSFQFETRRGTERLYKKDQKRLLDLAKRALASESLICPTCDDSIHEITQKA